jgi:hypothetical protein
MNIGLSVLTKHLHPNLIFACQASSSSLEWNPIGVESMQASGFVFASSFHFKSERLRACPLSGATFECKWQHTNLQNCIIIGLCSEDRLSFFARKYSVMI